MQGVRGSNPLSSTSIGPGRLAGRCGLSVPAFEQVSVDVVGGSDGGMPEPLGDDTGVLPGGADGIRWSVGRVATVGAAQGGADLICRRVSGIGR
jgi:hypothetical protein